MKQEGSMTGMIHDSRQGEVCIGCRRVVDLRDWTCPQCGFILDRFLFSTVTAKTVTGEDKAAFRAGYEACMNQWSGFGSTEVVDYHPPAGRETAYRAGWQKAADKIEGKQERKRGRRRGLELLVAGALFTAFGGFLLATAGIMGRTLVFLAIGVINLALGIVSVITGNSDACPDDVPGTAAAVEPPTQAVVLGAAEPAAPAGEAASPAVSMTWAVVIVNAAVFLAMLAAGVNILNPSTGVLLRWGANFGPRTTGGEWWRLGTSMFLHIGVLHIAFNMLALVNIGRLIERLLGKAGFALVYLVAGLTGSIASLAWIPYRVSAGASGAIFGLYGALIGFLVVHGRRLPEPAVSQLLKSALAFVGFNVIFGLTSPNIDMSAHIGGLGGGLVCGLIFGLPVISERWPRRALRNAVVTALAAPLLLFAAARLPHTVDVPRHLQRLAALETSTTAKFNAAQQRFSKREIGAGEFASVVETQVLLEWKAEHDTLASLRGLPPRQAGMVAMLVHYMELRREGWEATASGMKDPKIEKFIEAARKQKEASEQIQELTRYMRRP
jgi:rhomboid protease GluP